MKKGDKLVIYHTGDEKTAVGLAHVKSVDLSDPKVPLVYITAGSAIKRPKTLAEIKQHALFQASPSGPPITPFRGAAGRSAVRLDRAQLSYNRTLGLLAKQDATFFNGW